MSAWPPKDPDAKLDFFFDWTRWLAGDSITSATWDVPDGLTKESSNIDGDRTVVWLSGGTAGQKYEVTVRVTTAGGRIDDRTATLRVRER